MTALELVDWPADRTLALSGEARSLRIAFEFRNPSDRPVRIGELSLTDVRGAGGEHLRHQPIPLGLIAPAKGTTRARVRLRLDPATPPGPYRGEIRLGDLSRAVAIEIVERTEVVIRPSPLVMDAALGSKQALAAIFENRGNVPITIDLTGRYPLGLEIPLTPDRLERPVDGVEALGALLLGRVDRPLLIEAGQVDIAGRSERLAPGAVATMAIDVAAPGDLAATSRYHVFAPVYANDLHIVIVTAAKSKPTPRRRAKQGAAE